VKVLKRPQIHLDQLMELHDWENKKPAATTIPETPPTKKPRKEHPAPAKKKPKKERTAAKIRKDYRF